jgi:hypothetical protein
MKVSDYDLVLTRFHGAVLRDAGIRHELRYAQTISGVKHETQSVLR